MKKFMLMLTVLVFAGSAFAGLGINDNTEPFRLVFMTSQSIYPESAEIGWYNDWVQGLADNAGIGTGGNVTDPLTGDPVDVSWNIVGSTADVDARDNTGTNPENGTGVPIYLVDGTTLVANDNADLWDGEIAHIINQDEFGNTIGGWPWSGSKLDGTASTQFGPLGSGGNVQQGNGGSTTQWFWRNWTGDDETCVHQMYAMSEIIPEPATIALLGFGGMALLRRRKK